MASLFCGSSKEPGAREKLQSLRTNVNEEGANPQDAIDLSSPASWPRPRLQSAELVNVLPLLQGRFFPLSQDLDSRLGRLTSSAGITELGC